MKMKALTCVTFLTLALAAAACGGGGDDSSPSGDGDGDGDQSGDGDSDPGDDASGDGDGDNASGDGDGDSASGDGDGDNASGDGDGDGMGGAPSEEVGAPPAIESSYPEDGGTGFLWDDSIVVTFDTSMNTESVEGAYQSSNIPVEGVSFTWSENDTVVTIKPIEELKFNDGASPDEIELISYEFGIDGSAESVDGSPISEPLSVTFSTARGVVQTLGPVADLSGSVRSSLTSYSSIWVGDSGYAANELGDDAWYIGLSWPSSEWLSPSIRTTTTWPTTSSTKTQSLWWSTLFTEVFDTISKEPEGLLRWRRTSP